MDLKSKYQIIKKNFEIDVQFTPSQNLEHYRNRNVYNFRQKTKTTDKINSKFSLKLINKINKHFTIHNNYSLISILIKENSIEEVLVKVNINTQSNFIEIDMNNLKNFLIKNTQELGKKIVSIYYQTTNTNVNPTKEDEYWKLYGSDDIVEYYSDFKIKFHISPDSFSRVNYQSSIDIYKFIANSIKKGLTNNLILMGRDVNVPSLILNKYFKNIRIFTQCSLISRDLSKNNSKNTTIINQPKSEMATILETIEEDLIFLVSAGRKGLVNNVLHLLPKINIKQIIYISCNPKSFIKDISYLKNYFNISKIHLFDEFPNTNYCNIIAVLDK